MTSGPQSALAESPQDRAPTVPQNSEDVQPPETQASESRSAGAAVIVVRPTGANVIVITPRSDGITITDADGEATQSDAPLWPDHPRNGDPDADPGGEQLNDALADQDVTILLNRPSTTTHDGEAHAEQWESYYTTYWQLIANGVPFVECATIPVEECWITDPANVPTPEPEATSESDARSEPVSAPAPQNTRGTLSRHPSRSARTLRRRPPSRTRIPSGCPNP